MKREGKKAFITTPSSPRSTTTTAMEPDRSELTKDSSCYYPGCRKDANCSCEICLASINATLDLKPLSVKRPSHHPRPIPAPLFSDSPSVMATPQMMIRRRPLSSPCLKSTARVRVKDAAKEEDLKHKEMKCSQFAKLVLCSLMLIIGMEIGLPLVISRAMRPELSAEVVREIGERAFDANNMSGKLRMLHSELQRYVRSSISNCSLLNTPAWKINQDGVLLRTQCVLYKSAAEELSIWGWPLQTAGLLASSFSSRSFTVLSGRVTQWPEGNAGYLVTKERGSWVQDKYTTSAVQLDGQTWVLEYSRSAFLEHKGLCSATWEFLMYRAFVPNMKMISPLGWLVTRLGGYWAVDRVYAHPT